jgi:hypothetical protein
MTDPELAAMTAVHDALSDLEPDARGRVVAWIASRFELELPHGSQASTHGASIRADTGVAAPPVRSPAYQTVAELVEATRADGGSEQALAVAFWLQQIEANDGWTGARVNAELRNLGHAQANITSTLTRLMRKKPALVVQTAKSGRAQQARKTYKLTTAGIRSVEQMLGTTEAM